MRSINDGSLMEVLLRAVYLRAHLRLRIAVPAPNAVAPRAEAMPVAAEGGGASIQPIMAHRRGR